MFDLFVEGGSLFMGVLTLIFLLMIVQAVRTMIKYNSNSIDYDSARKNIGYIRSLGILAFVMGLFGQLIGLYQAFEALQSLEDVSPALMAGGLRVSMITTMYGTFILIISLSLWMILDSGLKSKTQ